jgi:polyhydroxyalkanoate synthesis regulator phasin
LLSHAFANQLNETLEKGNFYSADFIVTSNNSSYGVVVLKIKYKYVDGYYFSAEIKQESNKPSFEATFNPGEITANESKNYNSQYNLLSGINAWQGYIENELSVLPVARMHKENLRNLSDLEKRIKQQEDSAFTKEEVEELKERLGKLEEDFQKRIESKLEDDNDLRSELNSLRKEIQSLKDQSELLSKNNWLLSFCTRIHFWIKRYPKITAIAGFTAYGYLPEDIKEIIPKEVVDKLLLDKGNETE